ncbi:hypothetical protein PInf_014686 [Phytophthora infestans]|nr:hypothetical protein PInf_014686 [Phytophthora infestans]
MMEGVEFIMGPVGVATKMMVVAMVDDEVATPQEEAAGTMTLADEKATTMGRQWQPSQRRVPSNQMQHDDDAAQPDSNNDKNMGWWDTLMPDQQRHLAKRLFNQAPAATALFTVVVQAPELSAPRRPKMKTLNLTDFKG